MTENTWYDKGYNEGYEAAAKVAREQYALVDMWTDKVARLQAENARLRAALRPFADFEYDWDFPSAGYREFIHQAGELLADEKPYEP